MPWWCVRERHVALHQWRGCGQAIADGWVRVSLCRAGWWFRFLTKEDDMQKERSGGRMFLPSVLLGLCLCGMLTSSECGEQDVSCTGITVMRVVEFSEGSFAFKHYFPQKYR